MIEANWEPDDHRPLRPGTYYGKDYFGKRRVLIRPAGRQIVDTAAILVGLLAATITVVVCLCLR